MSKRHWVAAVFSCCFLVVGAAAIGGIVWAAEGSSTATITFGDVSLEIGMDKDEVIAALPPGLTMRGTEGDRFYPDLTSYVVHNQVLVVGLVDFRSGKLCRAIRHVMDGEETLDSQKLMELLTDLLEATSEKLGTTPTIRWDDGKYQGRKSRNRKLVFDFGSETVSVVSYDSPGASENVTLSVSIGKI